MGRKPCHRHIRSGQGHVTKPEVTGFDCTIIWLKQVHALHGKSMSWLVPPGLLEPLFAIGCAACRGSLLNLGCFPT